MRKPELLGGVLAAAAAGGLLWLAYDERSFAWVAVALACALVALALWVRPLRSALTVCISLLLALALGEAALGWMQGRDVEGTVVQYNPEAKPPGQYWNATSMGSSPRPGVHHVRKLAVGGELIYDVRYTIDDQGRRVTPGAGAGLGRARVNFLGDSGTFGEGLPDDQTVAAQLQARLPQTDVHNLAMSGYGMHQALLLMEDAPTVQGKVNVVITAPWHAERSACVPAFATGSPRYVLEPDGSVRRSGTCGVSVRAVDRVLSWSHLWNLTKTLASHKRQDAEIDLYLGLLRRIAELSRQRGQAMLVGFWAAPPGWFSGQYSNAKLVQAIQKMGVPVIELDAGIRNGKPDPSLVLHRLDDHPSAKGVGRWVDQLQGPIAQALR